MNKYDEINIKKLGTTWVLRTRNSTPKHRLPQKFISVNIRILQLYICFHDRDISVYSLDLFCQGYFKYFKIYQLAARRYRYGIGYENRI